MAEAFDLGTQAQGFADINELLTELEKSGAPEDLKEDGRKMIVRVYRMAQRGSYSFEYESTAKYIDWVARVPWQSHSEDLLDLQIIMQELDRYHYGLTKIKERILSYMSVMKMRAIRAQEAVGTSQDLSQGMTTALIRPPVLCFVGLQGLGKTTIAKSIADSLNRKFVRISLAAFGSIAQLRGTSKTTPDAEPGLIIQALAKAGTMNPVILLDEVDKTSGIETLRTDIMAALLEILDPAQNDAFIDRYLNYPVDLSKVFFIATANTLGTISTALLDRIEVIRFTSYSDEEKIIIGKSYVLPRAIQDSGLTESQLTIDEAAWPLIVRPMGFDAGIRQLERTLLNLARKVAYQIVTGESTSVRITVDNVKHYLPEDVGTLG